MSDVASLHEAEYGQKPTIVTSAPGVVNFIGAHTESTDGYLLLFAMNRRASVAASLREDGSIRFYAADLNERRRTSASALKYRQEDRFAGISKGVISRLQTLGSRIRGVNVTVSSDIPPGIGLASSQAIGVALAYALSRLYGNAIDATEAAQVAYYVEHAYEGLPVGFGDFLTSAVARNGHFLFIDSHRLDWTHLEARFDGTALVGVNTHAPSALTTRDESLRQIECGRCLELLSGYGNGCSFQDFTLEELASSIGRVPESARRYCLHIVAENERVLSCRSAMARGDLERIGKLLTESHESLRDLYEGTTPEVDWLVKHAHTVSGVYGARLAGGSSGTCALVFGRMDADDGLDDLLRQYERIFGFHPTVLTCLPDDGVRVDFREDT